MQEVPLKPRGQLHRHDKDCISVNPTCLTAVFSVSLSPASDLQRVLQPFLLRRVKAEVAADLPMKTEILMYHGLSALQKRYYKAILMKDLCETNMNLI